MLAELGSPAREIVAELFRVVAVVGAVTVMPIVTLVPEGMAVVMEQETVPEEPTAGVVQLQPAGTAIEEKVTPVAPEGRMSVRMLELTGAVAWPRFWIVIVYVRFEEMKTGVGATDIDKAMSELVVGSTIIEVMLVLFEGTVSTNVEFVTVAEPWMVVPAAVPAAI